MALKEKLKKIKIILLIYRFTNKMFRNINIFRKHNPEVGTNYNWILPYIDKSSATFSYIVEIGSRDALDTVSLINQLNPQKSFVFEPSLSGISSCCKTISEYKGNTEIIFLPFAVSNFQNGINLLQFREYVNNGNFGASSLFKWHTRFHRDDDIDKGIEKIKEVEINYKVPSISLDSLDFLLEKPIFLLAMDTEGAELSILQSAKKVLKRTKYICLETGFNLPREEVSRDVANLIIDFLNQIGFKVLAVDNESNSLPENDGYFDQFNILFENKLLLS
tara:strand:- start:601 stop:1431 length:831 start_codon:yes stop_codon:yes gene_type:complete